MQNTYSVIAMKKFENTIVNFFPQFVPAKANSTRHERDETCRLTCGRAYSNVVQ